MAPTDSRQDSVLSAEDIWEQIQWLLSFPYPTVCRHLVACNLLDLLERRGAAIPSGLAEAVVRAKDHEALQLIPKNCVLGGWRRESTTLSPLVGVAQLVESGRLRREA